MAFSAIRSRNIRHLIQHAFTCQFVVNFSRLTPYTKRALTGGVGMLTQADLDRFDKEVGALLMHTLGRWRVSALPCQCVDTAQRATRVCLSVCAVGVVIVDAVVDNTGGPYRQHRLSPRRPGVYSQAHL